VCECVCAFVCILECNPAAAEPQKEIKTIEEEKEEEEEGATKASCSAPYCMIRESVIRFMVVTLISLIPSFFPSIPFCIVHSVGRKQQDDSRHFLKHP